MNPLRADIDWKTYGLGVATALLLLIGGAWPRPSLSSLSGHDGQPAYFWCAGTDGCPTLPVPAAEAQAARVAHARGLSETRVVMLITRSTHNDTYNLAARPLVDVAELNARLDGKL